MLMHDYLFRRVKYVLAFTLALFLSNSLFAQVTVQGKVTSDDGQALPGVSVIVKGTTSGTTTDAGGAFSVSVPNSNSVLVFSYVGYLDQEIAVGNKTAINVSLSSIAGQLNEVVVIGYGTVKRKEVTNAVATVNSEQFNKGNISDVAQLLQGKVAGLSISRPGGDPNGGFTIRLRGLSTLGANTSPLIVIDGQVGADINTIDPNDIQSIDVLKDAASAAIYGTRGSSGVIIVTTKKGGRVPVVSYNGSVTAEDPAKFTPNMNAKDYKAAGGNDLGASTDWNKAITRTALSHIHNLSFSGGNGNGTSYIASVNYRDVQGIAVTTGFNQINGHVGLAQRAMKDKFNFTLDVTATRRESKFGWDRAFQYATIFNPTAPLHTDDPPGSGGLNLTGSGYVEQNFVEYANPLAVLEQNTNKGTLKRMNINSTASYEIIRGLKFQLRYAQENTSNYRWAYLPKNSFDSRLLGRSGFSANGLAQQQDDEAYSRLFESTFSYDKKVFSDLNLTAIAGYSYQSFLYNGLYIQAGDFLSDVNSDNITNAGDIRNGKAVARSYKNGSRLVAFFGRLNLNYKDMAFLSASLRREGSTQFGENNKWGMFPAVSAGLDITRLKDIPHVNSLKLRGSYGITGALPPSSYLSLLLYGPTGSSFLYNGVYIPSYRPTQNQNPDLKWERKAEFDVGLDFALLNNRLTGTFDYYNRETSDLLFNATVPVPPNPTDKEWLNIGTLVNKGVELLLGYDVFKNKDFSWNSSVNYSTFSVKLTKLNPDLAGTVIGASNLGSPGQEQTQITRAVEGEKIGIIWGPVYRGVNAYGHFLFDDGSGTNKTDTIGNYKTKIGNGLPKFELGWTNTFHYKNFYFNFFLRGSFGHDLVNTARAFFENSTATNIASYNVVTTKFFNPALKSQPAFSSLYVEKASFVKLDNATLGYDFNLKNDGSIKGLRVYITGQNLFTITNYTGVDPEVRYSYGGNILAPGVDARNTWVRTRSFTLGVNLKF